MKWRSSIDCPAFSMSRSTFSSAPAGALAGRCCAGPALAAGAGLTGVSPGRRTMYAPAATTSTPAMTDTGIHGILRGPEGAAGDAAPDDGAPGDAVAGDAVADAASLPSPS